MILPRLCDDKMTHDVKVQLPFKGGGNDVGGGLTTVWLLTDL